MPVVYSRKRLKALLHSQTAFTEQDDHDGAKSPSESNHNAPTYSKAPQAQSLPTNPSQHISQSSHSESPYSEPPHSEILPSKASQPTTTSQPEPPQPLLSQSKSPAPKRRKRNFVQTFIDAGQRDLSSRQCHQCHMVYSPGAPGDDTLHQRYHTRFLSQKNRRPIFPGWVGERVLNSSLYSGRLVAIKACDPLPWRRRIYHIDAFVSRQLTSLSSVLPLHSSQSAWLAILFIVGRAVQAYALADLVSSARPACISDDGIATLSTTAQPVHGTICGIRKIWVSHDWQRKGIATRLVDAARVNLLYGHVIPHRLLAFTPTTPAGALFARAYARPTCTTVLVYTMPQTGLPAITDL